MLKKTLLVLGATAATLGSGLALANPPYWAPAHGWRAHEVYRPVYRPAYRPYYVAPRPVYVMPAPRYVYAPPPPGGIPLLRGAGRFDSAASPAVNLSGTFPPRD